MAESLTPLPKSATLQPRTMDFPDAMRHVLNGKKVARISWGNADYGFLKNEWLTIFTKGEFHTWLVSAGDMEGNDWTIVKEKES